MYRIWIVRAAAPTSIHFRPNSNVSVSYRYRNKNQTTNAVREMLNGTETCDRCRGWNTDFSNPRNASGSMTLILFSYNVKISNVSRPSNALL